MLFNSLDFAIFLPIVFILYWFVLQKSLKWQNALVFIASYVFYGWWDSGFLWLILFSTLVNYFFSIGLAKYENERTRKFLLWTSVALNLGFLGFFKYYNFFLDSLVKAFYFFGHPISIQGLDIVLPIGISFYTFQTMGYTIDVYYEKIKPTKDFIAFGAFVSFFPLLLAGPIERSTSLLPQFFSSRKFEYAKAVDGCRQILWGLFKKIVIANNCEGFVETIFTGYQDYNGATLFLGAVFYAFQIYGDFSGYSDIALGISRLFGFELMQNFAFPYFSRNIAEFWRRWHISLTTWFTDYLFFPIAFKLRSFGRWGTFFSVFIVFSVSGLWHGASWNFITWGALHGLLFLPIIFYSKYGNPFSEKQEGVVSIKDLPRVFINFTIICIIGVFFRAKYMGRAFDYISVMLNLSNWALPQVNLNNFGFLLFAFVLFEWFGRRGKFGLQEICLKCCTLNRRLFYFILLYIILQWSGKGDQGFIYFQF
jgi:D-alanyl-lipoteichoic acid acyltransferase DltB (MBOAT superfamily)